MATEEVVEEVVETVADLSVRDVRILVAGAAVGGILVGMGVGFALGRKHTEAKYEQILDEEIAKAKQFYSTLNKREGYETPEKAVSSLGYKAAEALKAYKGESVTAAEVDVAETDDATVAAVTEVEVHKNVFVDAATVDEDEDDFDYEERIGKIKYIIHHDEYMNNESGYEQTTLTYFVEDDVLVDDQDEPIPNADEIVDETNLDRFGYGSKDNRIVYIRNDKLRLEFEVVRDENKYTEKVLGFIEHSDRPHMRRYRGDYE